VIGTHSSVDSWVGLLAASLCRVPCRLRYRHVSTPVHNNAFNRFQYTSLCDRIITTGECISGPLRNAFHLSKEKVRTIFTGINVPSDLPDRNEARLALAQELQLPSSSRFVGMVAVLRSWKGHAYLIDGFDQIADQFPDHHLILAGTGPQKNLQAQIDACKSKNRMHLIGYRENPWPVFRALDVAVLSSIKNEGIPQTGLQAMFAETPFIGTRVGGIPEIIHHMKTGVLVEPADSRSLADGLTKLLTDTNLTKEIASQAFHFADSHATMNICGKAVESLITSVQKARNTF
jgi:glycosyltransferase involved in cell wall biosynthesis